MYFIFQIYAEENFFNLFPNEVKPWDCLLLWGTKYSRSSLHMDPYNWTATNAVLSGTKLWKVRLDLALTNFFYYNMSHDMLKIGNSVT